MSFAAIRITKQDGQVQTVQVEQLDEVDLPDRGIAIDVEYSDVNFKDGLCIAGLLSETFPLTAGIDAVGTVTASDDPGISRGDVVSVNGWGLGIHYDGGFAQRARVESAWVTPVPKGLDSFTAAAIGTAGYASALAVLALQDHDVTPKSGPVLRAALARLPSHCCPGSATTWSPPQGGSRRSPTSAHWVRSR